MPDKFVISVDIEALGTEARAPIISVGAAVIDKELNQVVFKTQWYLNWENQVSEHHRELDTKSLLWWFSQSQDAQKAIIALADNRLNTDAFAHAFYELFKRFNTTTVLVNGAGYDIAILENFFWSSCNMSRSITWNADRRVLITPWHYRGVLCLRSLRDVFENVLPYEEFKDTYARTHDLVLHDALADATIQAEYYIATRKILESK